MNRTNKAFTLIELLVVIVIIGILATLVTVALNTTRQKARDSRRISDVKQIQTALEMFFPETNRYPTSSEFAIGSPIKTADSTKTFMAKVPGNPQPWNEGACSTAGSEYTYTPTSGATPTSYTLTYCLAGNVSDQTAGVYFASPSQINNACVPDCTGKMNLVNNCGTICPFVVNANTRMYYNLENFNDAASGFTLTNNGAVIAAAKIGNGFSLTKASNQWAYTYNSAIGTSGSFTMQAWIYPVSHPDNNPVGSGPIRAIVTERAGSGSIYNRATLYHNNSDGNETLGFFARFGSSDTSAYTAINLTLNIWYLVTGVYDASNNTLTFYINGVLVGPNATAATSGALADAAVGPLTYIGQYWGASGSTYVFDGKIDEVIVEKRAWSATEILNYYNNLK